MNVLAIDTATETLGLCLRAGDYTRTVLLQAGFLHSQTLLPQIQRLLSDAGIAPRDIELIVCCLGPGSFTGVRIGLATAKGLAFGTRCALVGAANLDALARRYRRFGGVVVPVNSSLRRRCYAALFQDGRRVSEYLEREPEELAGMLKPYPRLLLTGSAAEKLAGKIADQKGPGGEVLDLSLASSDPLGLLETGLELYRERGAAQGELHPLYLRKSEAEIERQGP